MMSRLKRSFTVDGTVSRKLDDAIAAAGKSMAESCGPDERSVEELRTALVDVVSNPTVRKAIEGVKHPLREPDFELPVNGPLYMNFGTGKSEEHIIAVFMDRDGKVRLSSRTDTLRPEDAGVLAAQLFTRGLNPRDVKTAIESEIISRAENISEFAEFIEHGPDSQ